MAILGAHAVIAFINAATVPVAGKKSSSAEHATALKLLRDVLGNRFPEPVVRDVQRALAEKDRFEEYEGHVVKLAEARAVFARAERVAIWAEQVSTRMLRSRS